MSDEAGAYHDPITIVESLPAALCVEGPHVDDLK